MCVWSIQADIIDFNDTKILDLVYRNADVDKFLKARDSMGIAACKGMGKTFLLKAKRLELMKNKSIVTLPKDKLVDIAGTISIESMHIKFLSSYSNWISLWISCISIYLLSLDEFNRIVTDNDMKYFPECVNKLIQSDNSGVFNVLNKILSFKSKENLNEVIHAAGLLFDCTQKIQQSVVLFVDKLEEPFNRGYFPIPGASVSAEGSYNASIWAYSQLAFAEAVYKFFSSRHHIKIFFSIRREALYRGEEISIEYSKIRDRIIRLKYTPDELYDMFSLYVSNESAEELILPLESKTNPIKAFLGFDKITHKSGIEENIWNYIYRHTFQRPRDIMEMCDSIHNHIITTRSSRKQSEEVIMRILRHWVNEISTMICRSYISFLEPFMSDDSNILFKEKILGFVRTLPTNIFSHESMNYYCHLMNSKSTGEYSCIGCKDIHYFSTLYNIGLLGCVYKSNHDGSFRMKIKHISESKFDQYTQSLPHGEVYYLHPGFANIVQKEREIAMKPYYPCMYVLNSEESVIEQHHIRYMIDSIRTLIGNNNDKNVFITSTERDLAEERKKIKNILEARGYTVYLFEEPEFPLADNTIDNQHIGGTHDHCIDVMLEHCKHIIYIFGKTFGGTYAGKIYKTYYEQENSIKIVPSISFMEYLVGTKNGKNVLVYVDEKVDIAKGEYVANGKPSKYKSYTVDDVRVLIQLGYFNQLGYGTWYEKYRDFEHLEKFITSHFPQLN